MTSNDSEHITVKSTIKRTEKLSKKKNQIFKFNFGPGVYMNLVEQT